MTSKTVQWPAREVPIGFEVSLTSVLASNLSSHASWGSVSLMGDINMMTLHAEFLVKDGKKQFAVLSHEEFVSMKERLEDMEDLFQRRRAKKAEGRKRSVPFASAKRQLGLR